jgi:hypothetical protein
MLFEKAGNLKRMPNTSGVLQESISTGRPCILIARSSKDVKFDLRGIRTLFHHGDLDNRLMLELAMWIDETLKGGAGYSTA